MLIGEYILALFIALKSFPMSFKSGEYFYKNSNSNWWPPASTNYLITFFIWIGELSIISTLGFFNDGNKMFV